MTEQTVAISLCIGPGVDEYGSTVRLHIHSRCGLRQYFHEQVEAQRWARLPSVQVFEVEFNDDIEKPIVSRPTQ